MILCVVLGAGVGRVDRAAAEPPSVTSTAIPAADTPEPGKGPRRLKERDRITVATESPTEAGTNGVVAPEARSFEWESSWRGWDGLYLGVSRQTRLSDPLADVRTMIQGTNAYRVIRLEEVRMGTKIGLKYAVDAAAFVTDDGVPAMDNGFELRRARIYARGDCLLVLPVSFQLEIGYIPEEFYIEESYLAFPDIPGIGELRMGQFQAPMGLDVVTSSRDLTFMEPSAALQALAPGTDAGFQIGRPVLDQRVTWRFGLFTDGVGHDFGDVAEDYGRAILRVSGLPRDRLDAAETGKRELLHLGLSANLLYSAADSVRYRSRPESHLAPYLVDTGDMQADGALVVGAEAALVEGPLCVQAEYLHSWVHRVGGGAPSFGGLYASASWFLTGESRPYDRAEGLFGRVIPTRGFNWGGTGWGAWEVAGRFSSVDLDDDGVQGGRLWMLMSGVNWYPHSHVKWRFDYGFGRVGGSLPEGRLHVFETRVEMDF